MVPISMDKQASKHCKPVRGRGGPHQDLAQEDRGALQAAHGHPSVAHDVQHALHSRSRLMVPCLGTNSSSGDSTRQHGAHHAPMCCGCTGDRHMSAPL